MYHEPEWPKIRQRLEKHGGHWKRPTYAGAIGNIPKTALLGNGDVGVVSSGDAAHKTYLLSKGDFWSAGSLEGDTVSRAHRNAVRPIALGGISFGVQAGAAEAISEAQNIADATLTSKYRLNGKPHTFHAWMPATQNLFVVEITNGGALTTTLEMNVFANHNPDIPEYRAACGTIGGKQVWASRTTHTSAISNPNAWRSEAVLLAQLTNEQYTAAADNGRNTASLSFTIQPGETATALVAVGGGGQTYSAASRLQTAAPLAQAASLLSSFGTDESLDRLRVAHQAWWHDYWMKSHIDIGDDLLHRFYDGSLYYMGCTARDGKTPPGLYGIWNTTDGALWNNDYHLNYNFMAPFYGMYCGNRSESARSLLQPLLEFLPQAERDAADADTLRAIAGGSQMGEQFWQSRPDLHHGIPNAALFPVSLGPWGSVPWNVPQRHLNQCLNGLFATTIPISLYSYTLDISVLVQAHPLLDKVAAFWEQWAAKERLDDGSRQYAIYDAPHEGERYFDKNSDITIGLLCNLLEFLVEHHGALSQAGLDFPPHRLEKWRDMLEYMPPIPTAIHSVGGQDAEIFALSSHFAMEPLEAAVNLEFVYPGERLGFDSDPEQLQTVLYTIAAKEEANPDIWRQINTAPKMYTQAIRAGMDAAYVMERFTETHAGNMGENFIIDDGYHGIEKAGAIEFINSMLLQSCNGITKVFPNWTGGDAGFTNLRAKGALLVSSRMKAGAVEYIALRAEAGSEVRLVIPWEDAEIMDEDGNAVSFAWGCTHNTGERTACFCAKPNAVYQMRPKR